MMAWILQWIVSREETDRVFLHKCDTPRFILLGEGWWLSREISGYDVQRSINQSNQNNLFSCRSILQIKQQLPKDGLLDQESVAKVGMKSKRNRVEKKCCAASPIYLHQVLWL
jgi:hypothetical protein